MNNNLDRHLINDRSRDEPTSTSKARPSRAIKIGGGRVARLFTRSSKEEPLRSTPTTTTTTPGSPIKVSSSSSTNNSNCWVCHVCSFKNIQSTDRCSRCHFYREKPAEPTTTATSKSISLVVSAKKPGAYEVVEKGHHQQLRPVQSTGKYTLKLDSQLKTASTAAATTTTTISNSHENVTTTSSSTRPGLHRPTTSPQTRTRAASPDSAAASVVANTSHSSLLAGLAEELGRDIHKDDASEKSLPPEEIYTRANDNKHTDDDDDYNKGASSSVVRRSSLTSQMQLSYGGFTDNDKGAWECAVCTYINEDALHLTCAVCGSRRDSSSTCGNNGSTGDLDSIASNLSDDDDFDDDDDSYDMEEREERKLQKLRMNELIMMQYELMNELANKGKSDGESGGEQQQQQQQESLDQVTRQMSEIVAIQDDDTTRHQHQRRLTNLQDGTAYDRDSMVVLPESTPQQLPSSTPRIPPSQQQQQQQQPNALDQWQQEIELNERKIRELQRQQEELMRHIEQERSRRN